MDRGDISNEIPPRVLVVFDGLLGQIPDSQQRQATVWRSLARWKKVAGLYDIDPASRARLHDLSWRQGWRIDVVTFDNEHVAEALADRFDVMNLAVSHVYSVADPAALSAMLAYMPEVRYVVHGMAEMQMAFGPRGVFGLAAM